MDKPLHIALLGAGTVGSAVAEILLNQADTLTRKAGVPLRLKMVAVRDMAKPRPFLAGHPVRLTDRPQEALEDPDIDIVVELMGGYQPAFDIIRGALEQGKSVVTANKEVLAKEGFALRQLAASRGLDLFYEASAGGGIPIIRPLRECLVGNRIDQVMGIINGTTNYMLTRMSQHGEEYEKALADAQEKGYAEADPTSDVEGHDAAYKLAILASLAFEAPVPVDAIYREGITKVTADDIRYGRELGYTLKLLAIAKNVNGEIEARVHPTFIPHRHPLASVSDAFNAIFIHGEPVGELMFYGRGAGGGPTASAVIADLVAVARRRITGSAGEPPVPSEFPVIKEMGKTVSRFYVSLKVIDRPGVLAAIADCFGKQNVSIESMIQKGREQDPVDLVFVTHEVVEANMQAALEAIRQLNVVHEIANVIRVEGDA